MATEKIVNYTEAQTNALVEAYKAAPTKATIEAFAADFGKSVRSIVAKLAKEGVYQSEAKASAGVKGVTKADIVAAIAVAVGVTAEQLESLEKATAPALKAVLAHLQDLAAQVEKLQGE